MIDYLIFIQTNKFRLIWSFFLKFMNFLIFRDFLEFFGIFLNFFEFILAFGILKLKESFLHRALMWQLTLCELPHEDVCTLMDIMWPISQSHFHVSCSLK